MALPGKPFVKVFGVLKQLAPTLLTAFGGPAGAIVAGIAKKALGDPAMADGVLEKSITDAAQTPDGLVKIKQIEADLQQFQLSTGVDLAKVGEAHYEAENADRADARARQIALKDSMPAVVFYVTSVGFFGLAALIAWRGLPASGGDIILAMVGTLGTVWISSTAYFTGTTRSSEKKGDTIAAIAQSD